MSAPKPPTRDQVHAACEALGLESTKVTRIVMDPSSADITIAEAQGNGDLLEVTYHLTIRDERAEAVEAAFRGESA